MAKNINVQYEPNTTNVYTVSEHTPYGMSCFPAVRFYDEDGFPVYPSQGVMTIEHSLDGIVWDMFTFGQVDFAQGRVSAPFLNGRVSLLRLTTEGLTGVTTVDVNYHIEDTQRPYQTVVADTYISRNVKRGRQFYFFQEIELAANETKYFAVITGADVVSLKFRQLITDGAIRYTPRSGATFTEVNLPLTTVVNLNGLSTNTSKTTFHAVSGAPANQGTPFDLIRSPEGQGNQRHLGLFGESDLERIIAPGTRILLKFENLENKAIFAVIEYSYYEGPVEILPEV